MEQQLIIEVRARLRANPPDGDAATRIRAAVLDHDGSATPGEPDDVPDWPGATAASGPHVDTGEVYLDGVTVAGFRGIGQARRLNIDPGPGLTLVVGRNGSGKSSFAEGLEMALTGTSRRWADRPKAWRETWRNLHQATPTEIAVDLVGLGDSPTTLTHAWPDDEDDVSAGTSVFEDGRSLADLGWPAALGRYRPLLSFNELGGMFDGPPKDLYDAIAALLGVEPLREAVERLRTSRLADEKPLKASKKGLPPLIQQLRASTDARAEQVLAALEPKTWDLPAALAALEEDTTAVTSDTSRLRSLVALEGPSAVEVPAITARLRDAAAAMDAAAATDAGRADRLAGLLRQAAMCVEHDGPMACPVCGSDTVLDAAWRVTAIEEAAALAEQADAVRAADRDLAAAVRSARGLLPPVPDSVEAASLVGLDPTAAADAWTALLAAPDDPRGLADHLDATVAPVEQAVAALRTTAAEELDRRADDWRPIVSGVRRWVEDAREAQRADARAKTTKVAEAWLADTASAIEADRFEPIRDHVQQLWGQLRLASNVQLETMSMSRSGARRSLDLEVTVDGSDANAIGVMSQGELHALALAVFLPRAMLDDSPFRFVVLDDPVQAMDPSRVDGLARVLEQAATTRQVVVFTHDGRLPEAVRRLGIDATVLEVHRQTESRVEVRTLLDPVERYLEDARALARTAELTDKARAMVVAQTGRSALESACQAIVRRRRLEGGATHAAVDAALDGKGPHDLVALALFDDAEKGGGQVLPTLRGWGGASVDVLQDCKRGTHVGERTVEDKDFVREVEQLIRRIRKEAP